MTRPVGPIVIALLALACIKAPPAPTDLILTRADTLLAEGNEVLAQPADLGVDSSGTLFIADAKTSTVIAFDPRTGTHRIIGRRGGGPGEFAGLRAVEVVGDTLWVMDGGNNRRQALSLGGTFLHSKPLPEGALTGAVSRNRSGQQLVALNGIDSALARRVMTDGTPGSRLGVPVVAATGMWDFSEIKRTIGEGRIPEVLRNITLPVLRDDGGAWLLLQAENRIERYDSRDVRLWAGPLATTEADVIREEFFALNRNEREGFRFFTLAYAVSAREVGSELWILLRMPEDSGTVILARDANGPLRRRIRIPGAHGTRGFVVDDARRMLYLLAYRDAVLLRAPLPE